MLCALRPLHRPALTPLLSCSLAPSDPPSLLPSPLARALSVGVMQVCAGQWRHFLFRGFTTDAEAMGQGFEYRLTLFDGEPLNFLSAVAGASAYLGTCVLGHNDFDFSLDLCGWQTSPPAKL